jgi:hypothetical protein
MRCSRSGQDLAFLLPLCAALAIASSAAASTLGISLSWLNAQGGSSTWTSSQQGTPTGSGLQESFVGQKTASSWDLSWNVTTDGDPFVNGVFSIQNNSSITQTYTFTVSLPISPAVTPTSTIGGSIGVTLTDSNGDGLAALSSANGGFVFNAGNDGTTTLQLLGPAFSISVPYAGGSTTASGARGLAGDAIASIAANGTISITHVFTLTPGDSAALTSFYRVTPVPEPDAIALLCAGALALLIVARPEARVR